MQISDMIPGVNIVSKSKYSKFSKVNVASVNGAGTPVGVLGGSTLRKFLGPKEHLDWLKMDFYMTKMITVQDYKHKKTNVNGRTQRQC